MSRNDQTWGPLAPIMIPLPPPSRTATPRPTSSALDTVPQSDNLDHDADLDQPQVRPRSDTMNTFSSEWSLTSASSVASSSGSPFPQTPETPSILGVLHGQYPVSDQQSGDHKYAVTTAESPSAAGFRHHLVTEESPATLPLPRQASPSDHFDRGEVQLGQPSETEIPAPLLAPASIAAPAAPTANDEPSVATHTRGSPHPPQLQRSQTSLREVVKRKLARSRSSFRSMRAGTSTQQDIGGTPSGGSTVSLSGSESSVLRSATPTGRFAKRGRLRSLFSGSRTGTPRNSSPAASPERVALSSGPVQRGNNIVSSDADQSGFQAADRAVPRHMANLTPSAPVLLSPPTISPSVIIKDYGRLGEEADYFSLRPTTSLAFLQDPQTDQDGSQVDKKGKGKAWSATADRNTATVRPSSLEPVSLFETMLPREVKVMVFQQLVASYGPARGNSRWSGPAAGRRELIKASRVSKSWRDLCLDGQLWPMMEITPFVAHMHPNTLSAIVTSARRCVKTLSLRGAERFDGQALLPGLADYENNTSRIGESLADPLFPSLTTLDLRGCASISSLEIVRLLAEAPELRTVNLKGVQAVSSEVIRALSKYSTRLEHLDVTRCWDLTLGDIVLWLESLEPVQAAWIRSLRIAGLKSYGHAAADLLPLVADRLVSLKVLDLAGCSHIFAPNFERFAQVLRSGGRTSTIQHLNISNCSSLTSAVFAPLVGLLPKLQLFEMAGLPNMFKGDNADELGLIKFLRSAPQLRKLDMEGTGIRGGVTDSLMAALSPEKRSDRRRCYDEDGPQVGEQLEEIRLGYAKEITAQALIRLVRSCPKLMVLEADNTAANNSVLRDFLRRRTGPDAKISLIDCSHLTSSWYCALSPMTRPRQGFAGHAALPFGYDAGEGHAPAAVSEGPPGGARGELAESAVLKTFWSWKRVAVPPLWREARAAGEAAALAAAAAGGADEEGKWASQGAASSGSGQIRRNSYGQRPDAARRGSSWWVADQTDADFVGRTSCAIM